MVFDKIMTMIAGGTGKGGRGWNICRIEGHIFSAQHHMNVLYTYKACTMPFCQGDSRRGGAEGLQGPQGGVHSHGRVILRSSTQIPSGVHTELTTT